MGDYTKQPVIARVKSVNVLNMFFQASLLKVVLFLICFFFFVTNNTLWAQAQLLGKFYCNSGTPQTYVVPAGVCEIKIKAWGAGGGGGGNDSGQNGNPKTGGTGGGGSFSQSIISVSAGDVLTIYVGCKGFQGKDCSQNDPGGPGGPGWGNGGKGGTKGPHGCSGSGGGGGGSSAVKLNGNLIMGAAGGGGGGGAGCVSNGGNGGSSGGGGNSSCATGGAAGANGNRNGATGLTNPNDGGGSGGGGGGYNNGGAAGNVGNGSGGCSASGDCGGAGGGRGDHHGMVLSPGSGTSPGHPSDPDLCTNCGKGGAASANGNDGFIQLESTSPIVTASASSNSPICAGTSLNLHSNGNGNSFSWTGPNSFSNGQQNPSIANATPAASGVYTVTVTNNHGCTRTANVSVTVKPVPVISATPPAQTICSGSSTSFALTSSVGGTLFTRSVVQTSVTGGTNGNGSVISDVLTTTGNISGTAVYTITPTANGCVGLPVTATATVQPTPFAIANPSSLTICSGDSIRIALTSFVSGTTYSWTVNPNSINGAMADTGSVIRDTLINNGSAPDSVIYSVTPSANGCASNPINITVVVNPIPIATATPSNTTYCGNTTTAIGLNSNVTGTQFNWTVIETGVSGGTSGGGTLISDSLNATDSISGTAIYTITPIANGCTGTAIIDTITVSPDPGATLTATPASSTICSGSATSISINSFASGAIFNWIVVQSGVTGATTGSGPVISQTLTATGSIPGTVTYIISATANGCTGNSTTVVVTVNPTPVVNINPSSQTLCSGDTAVISLSGPIAGTIFNWTAFSTGVTGATPGSNSIISQQLTNTNSIPGTVLYTITPIANGCVGAPVTSLITVNPMDDASFVYSSATYCLSGNNPTPIITGLGGGIFSSAPSGLVLDSLTGTITLATSSVGQYLLSYTTFGACPNTSSITMTIDNSTPFATFNYTDSAYCQNGINPLPNFGSGASAGVFSASPIGLSFVHINTGEIDLAGSQPGTYIITNHIPASGLCTPVTASYTITILPTDDASFVYSSATYCQTGTNPTPVVTGLSGGVFSSSPFGLQLDSITGIITLATSSPGAYVLSYSTNGACPNSSSIIMTIDSMLAPSAGYNYIGSPYCQNGINPNPFFSNNASAGFFTATPAGLTFVHVNTGEINLSASAPGTYIVTNTIPSSGACLAISATDTITIAPSDSASFVYSSATYCLSGGYETPAITGLTGGTFTALPPGLSLNPTTGTIDLATSAVGTYTLSYATNGSCPNSDFIVMTITDSTPSAAFNYSTSNFCQNTTNAYPTFQQGTSAGTFSVTPAGLVFANLNTGEINVASSTPGTYTITNTIPTSGNCSSTSYSSTLIINPPDNASFYYSSATFCVSGNDPTATITGLQGGTFSAVPSGLLINPATGTIDLSASALGQYTLTYTTFGTCPNTSSIIMTIADSTPSATFNYPAATYCQYGPNPSPIFNGQNASAGFFSASPSGIVFVHVNTGEIDLSASSPGTYTVTNNIPVSGNCAAASATTIITINAAPIITATPPIQYFCSGVDATTSIVLNSNVPGTTYSWVTIQSNISGAVPGNGSIITQNLDLIGPGQGIATYIITPTGNNCPGDSITATAIISPNPVADTTAALVSIANCGTASGSITGITMTSGYQPYTYQWQDSLGNIIGSGNIDLTNVNAGYYTLLITDANQCAVNGGSYTVLSNSAVTASFTTDSLTGEAPFAVAFSNTSTGATNYIWQFGTGDSTNTFNAAYTYLNPGTYSVCLTATNNAGCIDTSCTIIEVYINSVFIVPNVFTPNGDNVNDIFLVNGEGLASINAEVYNRWGQKLYEWNTVNGGWDGRTASGVIAPDGTYYYLIQATGIDQKKYLEKGAFQLIH